MPTLLLLHAYLKRRQAHGWLQCPHAETTCKRSSRPVSPPTTGRGGPPLAARGRKRDIRRPGRTIEVESVSVVAAGKAAGAMARAAEEVRGQDLWRAGITKMAPMQVLRVRYRPRLPSRAGRKGLEAARRVQEVAEFLGEGDLLLALISGGASALLADPAPPIELADLKRLPGDLLRSGADIGEINAVRKHVSVLKGGGLVRLAHPAPTIALLLSDVVGDDPSSIASGLTAPDTTTLENTSRVLERYGIEPPESITAHLRDAEETPASDDPVFEGVVNVVCGGGLAPRQREEGGKLGYAPLLLTTTSWRCLGAGLDVRGHIREAWRAQPAPPPCAIVSAASDGDRRGNGTGCPNQDSSGAAVELTASRAGYVRGLHDGTTARPARGTMPVRRRSEQDPTLTLMAWLGTTRMLR